jgi:hypothetical protein
LALDRLLSVAKVVAEDGAGRNMVTAPKTRLVQKQPHLLAYITPAEAALLKENGGTGEMVNGIPAFRPVKGKTSSGKSSAGTGFSGGSSGGRQQQRR